MSDVFDDIGGEKLPGDGYQFLDSFGSYIGEIQAARFKKGFKGKSLISEVKVIEVIATHEGRTAHTVGFVGSYVEKLQDDPKKSGGGRYRKHIARVVGAEDVTPDQLRAVMNDDPKNGTVQPLVGARVAFEVWPKVLPAKDGKPEKVIAAITWKAVEPEKRASKDQVNVVRKERGLLPL